MSVSGSEDHQRSSGCGAVGILLERRPRRFFGHEHELGQWLILIAPPLLRQPKKGPREGGGGGEEMPIFYDNSS